MTLRISDGLIWQETPDGVSIYQIKAAKFISLSGTDAKIWTLVASTGERTPIAWKIALEFAGSDSALAQRIRDEVDKFITAMVHSGLITETPPRAR